MLEREPRPLTFVNSLGLGDPASTDTIHRRLAHYPDVHFKLDAATAWTLAICEDLAATGAVDVVDFKGQYGMEVEDAAALGAMYERVVATFPDAILEDPHDLPEIAGAARPAHRPRLLRRADPHGRRPRDDAGEPDPHRQHQAVPHRRPARAARRSTRTARPRASAMYGGGMGENGVGRGQIQLLASIFHPDGPNDVAPSALQPRGPARGPAFEPAAAATGGNGLPPRGGLTRDPARTERAAAMAARCHNRARRPAG